MKPITEFSDDARADNEGVRRFAEAMKRKLKKKRQEGYSGWNAPNECSIDRLVELMRRHLRKGDPVDIANFCMMIWNRQQADHGGEEGGR